MNKIKIGESSNVLLDKCPEGQGIWFDGGELSKITNHNKLDDWYVNPEMLVPIENPTEWQLKRDQQHDLAFRPLVMKVVAAVNASSGTLGKAAPP